MKVGLFDTHESQIYPDCDAALKPAPHYEENPVPQPQLKTESSDLGTDSSDSCEEADRGT